MKRIITIILMTLTACTTPPTQPVPDTVSTDISQPTTSLPNPASVYCEQNGGKLEIVTAADGSQSGVCIFSDGSSCDEWAYFRGECGPAVVVSTTETSDSTETVVDWRGVIKSTEPGAQYDDYFERQDLGQVVYFGIDSMDPTVKSQIESLRDSGRTVHLYGTLVSNVPDYNGSQILVNRVEVEE